eukprot:2703961-Heterocapsa_arctica.AAC.1
MAKLAEEFNFEATKWAAEEEDNEAKMIGSMLPTVAEPADADIDMVIGAGVLNSADFVEQLLACSAPGDGGEAMDIAEIRKRMVETLGTTF